MTPLSHASCFNPGADLWVVPEPGISQWAKKVDWYLNFQLARGRTFSPQILSEEIVKVITYCELPLLPIPFCDSKKNLVASHALLPNRWSLQLTFESRLDRWTQQIFEVWELLRKPSVRIFLPSGVSPTEFLAQWNRWSPIDDLSLVMD